MELGEAKALGALNQHDRGIGNIDPNFDNGRPLRYRVGVSKGFHNLLFLFRF